MLFLVDFVDREEIQYDLTTAVSMRFREVYHIPEWDCRSVTCLYDVCNKYNLTLEEVVIIPERDGWLYSGKESIVCAGLVVNVLRAGGVFDGVEINANEFAPKDVYELNIYDSVWTDRPDVCWNATRSKEYCQVFGRYYMDLPWFNSARIVSHMAERCGGQPPDWKRYPEDC